MMRQQRRRAGVAGGASLKRCTKPSFGGLGAGVGGDSVYGWEEGRVGARLARVVFGSGGGGAEIEVW